MVPDDHSDGERSPYITLTDEVLKDYTIIRPGLPDPKPSVFRDLKMSRVRATTRFCLADVIIFFDKHSRYPVDMTGCNQWAFVVDDKQALYIRGFVRGIALDEIHRRENARVIRRIPPPLAPFVANFLLRQRLRPMLFQAAVNHIQLNNYVPILEGRFFPADVSYANDEEYEAAWQAMVATLEPRDGIFTFDRRSVMSRLIAWTTHGPFSHCATYAGDGLISEIVTSGTRIVPIETYKGRHYRVAAYRHYGPAPNTVDEMQAEMRAEDGRPGYDYLGAFRAGLRALVGKHRESFSPNSLIYFGAITFIAQA